MAPNLPESASFHSLDLSQHFGLTSKYQPLATQPLGEEEAAVAVSCDTIVANLLTEADLQECDFFQDTTVVRRASNEECKTADELESYWYMPSEKPDYFSAKQLASMAVKDAHRRNQQSSQSPQSQELDEAVADYWDWSSRERAAAKKLLEQKERNQQMLSCKNIAAQEAQQARQTATTKTNVIRSSQTASDDYFYQPSHDETKATQNYQTLEEDEAREVECYWDW